MGCRSMDTILTSSRGPAEAWPLFSASSFSSSLFLSSSSTSGTSPRSCWRNLESWSCHAARPNFSPLMSTRERTCDQLPGAAHRSTTRVTSLNRSNSPRPKACQHNAWFQGNSQRMPLWRLTFVQLEEFKGAARAPALLLCEPVVRVALILGGFAHSLSLSFFPALSGFQHSSLICNKGVGLRQSCSRREGGLKGNSPTKIKISSQVVLRGAFCPAMTSRSPILLKVTYIFKSHVYHQPK